VSDCVEKRGPQILSKHEITNSDPRLSCTILECQMQLQLIQYLQRGSSAYLEHGVMFVYDVSRKSCELGVYLCQV
jgi:hypothetical protein